MLLAKVVPISSSNRSEPKRLRFVRTALSVVAALTSEFATSCQPQPATAGHLHRYATSALRRAAARNECLPNVSSRQRRFSPPATRLMMNSTKKIKNSTFAISAAAT